MKNSLSRFLHLLPVMALCLALAACGSSSGGSSHGKAGKLVKQYGGEKTRPDQLAERYIILTHPHSHERVAATYYHNGAYDPAVMKAINKLMRDRRAGEVGAIDPELIDFLVDIRTRLALPPTIVFEILSGYRTPATNAAISGEIKGVARGSLHMQGLAVDFRVQGVNGSAIAEIAKTMQRGGVSFYPRDNHVHVDIGNIRTWRTN